MYLIGTVSHRCSIEQLRVHFLLTYHRDHGQPYRRDPSIGAQAFVKHSAAAVVGSQAAVLAVVDAVVGSYYYTFGDCHIHYGYDSWACYNRQSVRCFERVSLVGSVVVVAGHIDLLDFD